VRKCGRGGASGPGGGRRRPTTGGDRAGKVESPRTDEQGVSDAGREQPPVEPPVDAVPQEVAQAPDTTTEKTMHEDPTKLEKAGDEGTEKSKGKGSGSRATKKGKS
jgi:hypothetical protein